MKSLARLVDVDRRSSRRRPRATNKAGCWADRGHVAGARRPWRASSGMTRRLRRVELIIVVGTRVAGEDERRHRPSRSGQMTRGRGVGALSVCEKWS